MPLNAPHRTTATPIVVLLLLLQVPCWGLEMQSVPTSISIFRGEDATIPCNFQQKDHEKPSVSWRLFQTKVNKTNKCKVVQTIPTNLSSSAQNLIIRNANTNHSGLYMCNVAVKERTYRSCGTYLRVRGNDPAGFLSFNVAEATKNKLITAEGIILLLCAIIPGTFLLYKRCQQSEVHKRIWEAYSTAGKAIDNDYTSLTAVELLGIQETHRAM